MGKFVTPLFEVSTEVNLAARPIAEFRANTFYSKIEHRCPKHQQFPLILIPPEIATPEQLHLTPAIYRFWSEDEKWSTFLGPRMAAANVRVWPGYPEYRGFVLEVMENFLSLAIEPIVERFSIGFYNRIEIDSISELKETISIPLDIDETSSLQETLFQRARMTEVGSVLTQIIMMQGDAYTPKPYVSINNIIRGHNPTGHNLTTSDLLAWLDKSHDVGKEAIWTVLSQTVKDAWEKNDA